MEEIYIGHSQIWRHLGSCTLVRQVNVRPRRSKILSFLLGSVQPNDFLSGKEICLLKLIQANRPRNIHLLRCKYHCHSAQSTHSSQNYQIRSDSLGTSQWQNTQCNGWTPALYLTEYLMEKNGYDCLCLSPRAH